MEHKDRNFFDPFQVVKVLLGTRSRNSRLRGIFLIKKKNLVYRTGCNPATKRKKYRRNDLNFT